MTQPLAKCLEVPKIWHREPMGIRPDPTGLARPHSVIDIDLLRKLSGRSILSCRQFSKPQVRELCRLAALLEGTEIASYHPLDGKIAITGFFEPSTRTRLSFESAVLRLDGKILSVQDARSTGVAKGESLADIGEMFNNYGDVLIMRHTVTESIDEISETLRIPLINAGNGSGEHPTQALADWFALLKWRPDLGEENVPDERKVHLGIVGTPANMRAVRSFLLMSLIFKDAISKITVVSEMADPLGRDLADDFAASGVDYVQTHALNEVIEDLDVIYINSIALLGDGYKTLGERYKLNGNSPLKKGAVVLHPLARRNELDTSLDRTAHNLYFAQAQGAVFIRQALLISVLDRFERLPEKFRIPGWNAYS